MNDVPLDVRPGINARARNAKSTEGTESRACRLALMRRRAESPPRFLYVVLEGTSKRCFAAAPHDKEHARCTHERTHTQSL